MVPERYKRAKPNSCNQFIIVTEALQESREPSDLGVGFIKGLTGLYDIS